RKQIRRRRRVSFTQMARNVGPSLQMAFRRARASLWRFKRSPVRQDRAAMAATFAFIGLFAIGSVDAIITGRADFAPGAAYASEYQAVRVVTPAPEPVEVAAVEEPEPDNPVKTADGAPIDYSYTTEILLGGPELILFATPLFEDVLAEGEKIDLPEPVAELEADPTAL